MTLDPKFGTDFGEESHGAGGYAIFNRLIQRLNAIVASNPEARQNSPGTETDGTHYIVGDTPGGDWSSFATDSLAIYFAGASATGWVEVVPQEGWLAWNKALNALFVYDGSAWVDYRSTTPTADVQIGPQQLLLDADGNTVIDGSTGDDIALTVGGDNTYTFSNTLGFRIIDRTTASPTQMQIDQASTAAYAGSAGFTTFTGDMTLGIAGGGWTPQNLPSGYTNTNPGWCKMFNGTAEVAFPFVSLA